MYENWQRERKMKKSHILICLLAVLILSLIFTLLPAIILDILISVNLILSFVVFIATLYTKENKRLSLLPAISVYLTLLNLLAAISITILILINGIDSKSRLIYCISSEFDGSGIEKLTVSFSFFLIYIAIQFIVLTKGTTRISEVSARFTLDSMDVKSIAVEAEYASGTITEEEAIARKDDIQKESDIYGSMDGSCKILSWNEKFKLFLLFLILSGGILINYFIRGSLLTDAIKNSISLVISGGLLFMLPSLFHSLSMGLVVTRIVNKK
jgi:flagellar biosynthesis protein FlhA